MMAQAVTDSGALLALLGRAEIQLLKTSSTGRAYRELLCPVPGGNHGSANRPPDSDVQPEPEPLSTGSGCTSTVESPHTRLESEPEPEPEQIDDGIRFIAKRLLRARSGNVDAAAMLLQTILSFREEHHLPNVHDSATVALWQRLLPLLPVGYSSVPAACGSVVEVWDVGKAWPAEILESCSDRKELVRAYLFHIECGQQAQHDAALALGLPHVQQQIMIYNLAGLGTRHIHMGCVNAVVELLRIAEAHYPDNMRKAIVINTPTMFASVWSVISAVLSEETVSKVAVCADDGLDTIVEACGGLERVPTIFGGSAPIQLGPKLEWQAPVAEDHLVTVPARDKLVLVKDLAWLQQHNLIEQRGVAISTELALNESMQVGSAPEHQTEWVFVRFSTVDYPIAFLAEWVMGDDAGSMQPECEQLDLLESMAEWKVVARLDGKYLSQVVPHDVSLRLPTMCDGRGFVRLTFANDFLMTPIKLWHNWIERGDIGHGND